MAMNKQRRTSNLNNIVRYDTSGNVSLPAGLTVEGLDAGFVKSDANGLFSIDTAVYLTLSSLLTGYTVGANADIAATDTILQAFGKLQGQIDNIPSVNIYNSNGTLTGDRVLTTGANKLTITDGTDGITFKTVTPSGIGGFYGVYASGVTPSNSNYLFAVQSNGNGLNINTASGIGFCHSGTAKMFFYGFTGNLMIGTTTDAGYRLDVQGTGRFTLPLTLDSRSIKTANATAAYYFQGSALWLGNFTLTDPTTGNPSFYDQMVNKVIIGNTSWATNVNNNIIAIGMNQTGSVTTYGGILIGNNSALHNGQRHDLNIVIGHSSGIGFTGAFNVGKNIVIGNSSQTTSQPNATKLTIIGNDITSDLANAVILGETTQSIIIGAYSGLSASAKVQVDSTTQGFLQPRMTTTQRNAIATPATGLSVYNTTTNTSDFYNGTAWISGGINIYNSDGTLTGNRTMTMGGNTLTLTGSIPNITTGLLNLSSTTSGWLPLMYFSTSASNPAYIRSSNNYFNVIRNSATNDVSFQSAINQSWSDENGGLKAMLFRSTGNFLIQTGGTFTDSGFKLDVQGTGRFTGDVTIPTGKVIIGSNTNGINLALDNDAPYPSNQRIKIGNIGVGANSTIAIANTGGVPYTVTGGSNILLGTSMQSIDPTAGSTVVLTNQAVGFGGSIKSNTVLITGNFYQFTQNIQDSVIIGAGGGSVTWYGKDYLGSTTITNAIAIRASAFSNAFTANATDVAFGQGLYEKYFNFPSAAYTIHGTTPIDTANSVGANMGLAGGRGTGNNFGGDILFSTSNVTTSGTTIQTLSERMRVFGQNGYVRVTNGIGFGQIANLGSATITGSNTGGSLSDGMYIYNIVAVDALGGLTTFGGGEDGVSLTGTGGTGSVSITWTAAAGAVSYRIYRKTYFHGIFAGYFTSTTNSFTDTGGALTPVVGYPLNNNTVRYYIKADGLASLRTATFTNDILVNGLTVGLGSGSVSNNTTFGFDALDTNTTGGGNTVLGYAAMQYTTTASNNTVIGYQSGYQLASNHNTGVGFRSIWKGSTGSNNTGIGSHVMEFATGATGEYNTAVGSSYTMAKITSGSFNVGIGNGVLRELTSGVGNVALGQEALSSITTTNGSVAIGAGAFYFNTGGNNIAIGQYGGRTNTTGEWNIYLGVYNQNSEPGITTGSYNTIIGSKISGLAASLSNNIVLADGQGNIRIRAFNTGNVTINGNTDAGYKLDVQGTARVTGNVTLSTTGGSQKIRFEDGVYIEDGAVGGRNVQIGNSSGNIPKGTRNVAIGNDSNYANAGYQVVLGQATSRAANGIAIGQSASAGSSSFAVNNAYAHDFSVAIATQYGAITTASGQFVVEAAEWYLRSPALTDQNGTASSINGTGVTGTNFAGGNITIAGGKGTGTGTPGDVIFSTATSTASGTTLQSLTQRVWIKGENGNVGIGASPNASYKLDVAGTGRFTNTLSVITTGTTNEVALFKSTEPYITVEAAGGSNSASIFLKPSTSSQNATIQNRTGGGIEFYTGATPSEVVRFAANGNVGINNNNPGQKLSVSGNSQINHAYTHTSGVFTSGLSSFTEVITGSSPSYTSGMFYGAFQSYYRNEFSANATIPNSAIQASQFNGSQIRFINANTAITMTQGGTTVRAYTNQILQFSFDNAQTSCSVSHVAGMQILSPYYQGANNPTITNYYGLILNDSAEYNASMSVTTRWGIYQDGASDNNYFKGKVVIGSTNTVGSSPLNVKNLPTSSSGLATGDIWNDAGTLKIV
jgi:hypothetical protein